MMWPFSRRVNRPESEELRAARAAEQRAIASIQAVSDRTGEVDVYYNNLRKRRKQNNFGPALEIAMGKR